MTDWDTQKKALLPYLQRAAEIEAVDPKVAYYCRLYAVEQGIKLEQRDQKADELLELVLNQLEKDKPHLVLDTTTDLEHCERFALNVYVKAKRRDEQGISDRDTAKAYYAAFNFIEILKQFGALSADVEKERRFAVFRAAEIKRCLDEGRDPPALVPSTESEKPKEDTNEDGPPPQQKPGGPPLIDYDPGYVLGSKVLFMDGDSGEFRRGFIRAKSQEVGGFFNIEAIDGSQRQLGALFLAPDLSEGGDVTYFFPDGRQMNGVVTEMHASEWPPFFTLQLEDGVSKVVNHSQFVLVSGPIAPEMMPDPPEAVEPTLAPTAIDSVDDDESIAVRSEGQQIRKQESWLKHKADTVSLNGQQTNLPTIPQAEDSTPATDTAKEPETTNEGNTTQTSLQVQSRDTVLTPEGYFLGEIDANVGTAVCYTTSEGSLNAKTSGVETIARTPGFEPDSTAIHQATKFTNKATAALNFSDVDRAIKCLQEALHCLTRPSGSS